MECPECGTTVEPDAGTCPVCGLDLPGGGPDETTGQGGARQSGGQQPGGQQPGDQQPRGGDQPAGGQGGRGGQPGGQGGQPGGQGGQPGGQGGQGGQDRQPTGNQPGQGQPSGNQPGQGQPAGGQPGGSQGGQPTGGQPGGRPGQGGQGGPGGQPDRGGQGSQPGQGGQSSQPGQGGQPTGGQPTGGQGGQPTTGQPGRVGQGGQGGQPGRGGQPGQGPAAPGGQPGQGGRGQRGQPPAQSGGLSQRLGEFYDARLSELPLLPGFVGGVVVFLLGLGLSFGAAAGIARVSDSVAALGFVPTANLQTAALLFFLAQFAVPGQVSALIGTVPPAIGALYVLLPWLLLVVGTRFADYYATEGEVVEHVLVGATPVLGYLPAVLVGGIVLTSGQLIPPGYGTTVVVAGLVYPLAVGSVGGLYQWFLDDHAGFVPKLTGFGASLLVFLLVVGVTAGAGGGEVTSAPLALVVLSVLTFVGSHAFTFAGGGLWAVAYLLPLLVVLVVGYVRGRRAGAVEYLDGVRAGSSIAFGYSCLVFLLLVLYSLVSQFGTELADAAGQAGADTLSSALNLTGPSVVFDPMASGPAFLLWFVLAGVAYPFVVGGLGGLLASVQASRTGATATAGPQNGQPPRDAPGGPSQQSQPQPADDSTARTDQPPAADSTAAEGPAADPESAEAGVDSSQTDQPPTDPESPDSTQPDRRTDDDSTGGGNGNPGQPGSGE